MREGDQGDQGPGAGALRDQRAAGQGQRAAVGARRRPRRARWTARDRADKETLAKRNIVSQSAARPGARRRPRTRPRWSRSPKPSSRSPARTSPMPRCGRRSTAWSASASPTRVNRCRSTARSWRCSTPAMSRSRPRCRRPTWCACKVGQPATVHLEGFGEREFNGQHHPHQPDGAAGLALDPGLCRDRSTAHEALRGGLFATGTVVVAGEGHALAVPAAAMRKDDAGRLRAGRRERRAGAQAGRRRAHLVARRAGRGEGPGIGHDRSSRPPCPASRPGRR